MSSIKVGSLVTGTIVSVSDNVAYIDIGQKCEGRMYLDYYTNSKEVTSLCDVLKVGQTIKVQVSKKIEDGVILLSRLEMEQKVKRDKIIRKIMNKYPFTAHVVKIVNDGILLSKDDVTLFCPDNYISLDANFDKNSLLDTDCKVVFIKSELDEKGRTKYVVSKKQVEYSEMKKARAKAFDSIAVDDVLEVEIARFTDFGAFVKINEYVEGLVHLSEVSHLRITAPSDVLEVGQKVMAKVIKKTETKVHLSIKALQETPWQIFMHDHKVGDEVDAKCIKKGDGFMLFEVIPGVVGILNKNDYSWKENDGFAGSVEEGSVEHLKITQLDAEKSRMSLSKKHLEYNPWGDVSYRQHEMVSGEVLRFTQTGAIIKVNEVEGFLPDREASELGKTAAESLEVGSVHTFEVLRCDPRKWQLTLSLKSIEEAKTRENVDKYLDENVESSTSLKDLFK